jgi:hypothetical protein
VENPTAAKIDSSDNIKNEMGCWSEYGGHIIVEYRRQRTHSSRGLGWLAFRLET